MGERVDKAIKRFDNLPKDCTDDEYWEAATAIPAARIAEEIDAEILAELLAGNIYK